MLKNIFYSFAEHFWQISFKRTSVGPKWINFSKGCKSRSLLKNIFYSFVGHFSTNSYSKAQVQGQNKQIVARVRSQGVCLKTSFTHLLNILDKFTPNECFVTTGAYRMGTYKNKTTNLNSATTLLGPCHSILIRAFKWDTGHSYSSREYENTGGKKWKSEKNCKSCDPWTQILTTFFHFLCTSLAYLQPLNALNNIDRQ